MEIFGCCHRYVECSDAGQCLQKNYPEYIGCQYRKNLEAGRVFYGRNAFKKQELSKPKAVGLFLFCYSRLFAIKARAKNTYSYDLSAEQVEKLKCLFGHLDIPCKEELTESECFIDTPDKLDPTPANSRVVITVNDEEFNVMNFNMFLIKSRYAEKISAAFKAKGLDSRVELMGQYASTDRIQIKTEQYKTEKPKVLPKTQYIQVSIFDVSA